MQVQLAGRWLSSAMITAGRHRDPLRSRSARIWEKITIPPLQEGLSPFRTGHRQSAIADYITVHDETVDDTKGLTIFDPMATWKRKDVLSPPPQHGLIAQVLRLVAESGDVRPSCPATALPSLPAIWWRVTATSSRDVGHTLATRPCPWKKLSPDRIARRPCRFRQYGFAAQPKLNARVRHDAEIWTSPERMAAPVLAAGDGDGITALRHVDANLGYFAPAASNIRKELPMACFIIGSACLCLKDDISVTTALV